MSINKIIESSSKKLPKPFLIKSKEMNSIEHKNSSYKFFKDALKVTRELIEEDNENPYL